MQTAAEAFMPMWIALIIGVSVIVGVVLAAFGVVFAVSGARAQAPVESTPDAAPCPTCGALVSLAKRACPECGARVG